MEQQAVAENAGQKEIRCKGCGAALHFMPGTTMMGCASCGAENEIEVHKNDVQEIDFESFLTNYMHKSENVQQVTIITCESCKAQTELKPNIVSTECDFCGSPVAVKGGTSCSLIKPKSVLPFAVAREKGVDEFKKWIKSLWFAPSDLKKFAHNTEKLHGVYIPYWTYDSKTDSQYTGMRGVNRTETYSTTINGKSTTQTRVVVDWYPCSGYVNHFFNDVLVKASTSLPKSYVDKLEPWDLENLVSFDEKFLSGFLAESYTVDLKNGFEDAKGKMDVAIREMVKKQIGGSQQRITTLNTTHGGVTFKHILLPIWLSTFRYKTKSYRFMVNGRTGEVQGERPYSYWKIFGLIGVITAVIVGGILIYNAYK